MMKFPNFGQRRSNQSSIDDVSNAETPIQPEDTLEDEMAGLSAEEAAEIRDAFNVILHSDQEDPMLETAMDIEGELAAEPEFLAAAQVQQAEPELNRPSSLMAKFDLDITPLIVPTVITEPIEHLNPYNLSQDLALTEDTLATEGLDVEITAAVTDTISTNETDETEVAADSSYDTHTDGPLTYFQYYLDGESGEAAEYNPVSLRRPSIPTGLVGAGILGAALISGFSIADAMKQGQPVAKRPTPSPLQDLKTQATPPPVVPAPPESLQPEISALPPAPQVNRAALGSSQGGASANLPIVPPPAPSMAAISQPSYNLQQGGGTVASIAPVSMPQPKEPPDPISEVQTPSAPINMPPASNPQILPPPPLPSGILSEPQPVVVSSIPDPAAPEANPAAQTGATNLQPLQAVTPEVMATAPEMSQPNVGILPRPALPSSGPVPATLPEVLPALDRLSSAATVKETVVSGNELVFDRKPMPPGAIETPQAVVPPAESALQTLLTPPQNRGFLADDATLRSLSQQEAVMLTQANGIEPFTKRTLTIRDYARAYQVASKQVNGLPPFGFIDYQQKTITLPDESSTVSSTAPANGVPQS